jgi:hypothetical protein
MSHPADPRQEPPDPEEEGIPSDEEHPARKHTDDATEAPVLPGHQPFGLHIHTTAAEQRRGDTVAERLKQEVPDRPEWPHRPKVGRLLEPQEDGVDVTKELVAWETDDVAGESAEEAAMHEIPEPTLVRDVDRDDEE